MLELILILVNWASPEAYRNV